MKRQQYTEVITDTNQGIETVKTIMHETFPKSDEPLFESFSDWEEGPRYRDGCVHIMYDYGDIKWTLTRRINGTNYMLSREYTPEEINDQQRENALLQEQENMRNLDNGKSLFTEWYKKNLNDLEQVDRFIYKDNTYIYTYKPRQHQWTQTYIVPP